jgi:hypothetical protein
MQIERVTLTELQRRGQIDGDIAHRLAMAVDARLVAIQTSDTLPNPPRSMTEEA